MDDSEIQAMHGQPVLVLTHGGTPVSLGRIRVTSAIRGSSNTRVEILFETETMACALGVPLDRLDKLRESHDGDNYRHRLPPGDKVWLPDYDCIASDGREAGPLDKTGSIETYPLPPTARLVGPTDQRPKTLGEEP